MAAAFPPIHSQCLAMFISPSYQKKKCFKEGLKHTRMSTENLQVHIYGAGVEAAVLTAKTRNTENMNTQFLLCRVAVIWCTISVQNVDTAPRSNLYCCCTGHFYFLFALFLLSLLQHCSRTTSALLVGNHSLKVLPEQGKFLSGSGWLQLYYSRLLGYITVQQYGGKNPC